MKKFYITEYKMARCEKYERIGTYERIISPKEQPLYAILPADEKVESSIGLTPILYVLFTNQ